MNQILLKVGALVLGFLAFAFMGYTKGRADQRGETEAARADLTVCKARNGDKDAAISAQNSAVEALKAAASAKGDAADMALKLAQQATERGRDDVARILAAKAPVGTECKAAEALIAREMGE